MSRILLIDDDDSLRRALRLALEKSGFAVTAVGDGRAGLAAFEIQPVDLVITDLVMPNMEGVETIRALRKLAPHVPIIAISGGGRGSADGYLNIAKILGAALTLEKPLEPADLCAAVTRLLEQKSAHPPA